jgi:carbon storage regulator
MLVLSRKKNESIVINGNIRIEVLQIKGKQIRLGITAPASMKVLRGELPPRDQMKRDAKPASTAGIPLDRTESPSEKENSVVECDLHALVGTVMASV